MTTETHPAALDRGLVRRAFERAADTYDAAAVLQREVGARMAERLGIIKLTPTTILDAGCGTGEALGELRTRYPAARLVALDLALNMTLAARRRSGAVIANQRSLLARLLGPRAAVTAPGPEYRLRRHRTNAIAKRLRRTHLEQPRAPLGRRAAVGL